jgi:hypothetical protein
VHQVDKDPKQVVVVRINVKKLQEALGHSPDIFVPHGKQAQTGEDDDDPFRKLNGGDGAHAFDVSGIVDSGMRDSGMHLAKIDFLIIRHLIVDSF